MKWVFDMVDENVENLISHKIIKSAIDYRDDHLNLSFLAEMCDITKTGLYYCLSGRRKWNVEVWLKVLTALDCIEVEDDLIVIHTKKAQRFNKTVQAIQKYRFDKKSIKRCRSGI